MREPVPLVPFNAATYLADAGLGRKIVHLRAKDVFFVQGSNCESVYYLQKGRAKLTVVSAAGKEATISLLEVGGFVGEECVAGVVGPRLATATAITACTAMKSREKR